MTSLRHFFYGSFLAVSIIPAWAGDGENIYNQGGENSEALACITCHGADGRGMDAAGFPDIAGFSAGYLAKQIHDIRNGTRKNAIMLPIAKALSDQEIQSVSAYMESLDRPVVDEVSRAKSPENPGERLALRGDWSRDIPECVACHGPSGVGVGEAFPPLAGQGATYLATQLHAWQQGTRTNDENDLMGHIARALTDDEIKAVSDYFAGVAK